MIVNYRMTSSTRDSLSELIEMRPQIQLYDVRTPSQGISPWRIAITAVNGAYLKLRSSSSGHSYTCLSTSISFSMMAGLALPGEAEISGRTSYV